MQKYLINYFLNNTWCNPVDDRSYIISPARINKLNGSKGKIVLGKLSYKLPVEKELYSVFQIGQLNPELINIITDQPNWLYDTWYNVEDVVNNTNMLITTYNDNGLIYPKYSVYYMYTNDRNLVIAINYTQSNAMYNYTSDKIWLRFYSPGYFNNPSYSAGSPKIISKSDIIKNTTQINDYANQVSTLRNTMTGTTLTFVNGLLVDDINSATTKVGDIIEYVYDGSIRDIIQINISDLQEFDSILDNRSKYLIHQPLTEVHNYIDYMHDIDFYLNTKQPNLYYTKGLYLHYNSVYNQRMLTNRDYSLDVTQIANNIDYFNDTLKMNGYTTNQTTTLTLVIRYPMTLKPLGYENNRIFELYKLPTDNLIKEAMVGMEATNPIWNAANLESSMYSLSMSFERISRLTIQVIEQAYGYNAISKILGDSPKPVNTNLGVLSASVPYGLRNTCTCYEYDVDGTLLGYYYHNNGEQMYVVNNTNAYNVEMIYGKGDGMSKDVFGLDNIPYDNIHDFRLYMCIPTNGEFLNWQDITDKPYYAIQNNKIVITDPEYKGYGYLFMLRTNEKFLAYDITMTSNNGVFNFPLSELQDRNNTNVYENYNLNVTYETIDVFLNNNMLVEGIDYYINYENNIPYFTLISKQYLTNNPDTTEQKIHIRAMGPCNPETLKHTPVLDSGFIVHGRLSSNDLFNIRDDKVLSIYVNGKFKTRDQLKFAERDGTIRTTDPTNGYPYLIHDIVVPLVGETFSDTYKLRSLSEVIDKQVSDYLTLKLPQPTYTPEQPSAIIAKHRQYSPFINRIVAHILAGVIPKESYSKVMTDNDYITIAQEYSEFYDLDPTNPVNNNLNQFTIIDPVNTNNVISLDYYQYQLVKNIIRLYSNNLIDYSSWFTISTF